MLTPLSSWVTVAVLVNCHHEHQYLLDLNGSHSASAAERVTRQAQVFTQSGEIQPDLLLETANTAAPNLWRRLQ